MLRFLTKNLDKCVTGQNIIQSSCVNRKDREVAREKIGEREIIPNSYEINLDALSRFLYLAVERYSNDRDDNRIESRESQQLIGNISDLMTDMYNGYKVITGIEEHTRYCLNNLNSIVESLDDSSNEDCIVTDQSKNFEKILCELQENIDTAIPFFYEQNQELVAQIKTLVKHIENNKKLPKISRDSSVKKTKELCSYIEEMNSAISCLRVNVTSYTYSIYDKLCQMYDDEELRNLLNKRLVDKIDGLEPAIREEDPIVVKCSEFLFSIRNIDIETIKKQIYTEDQHHWYQDVCRISGKINSLIRELLDIKEVVKDIEEPSEILDKLSYIFETDTLSANKKWKMAMKLIQDPKNFNLYREVIDKYSTSPHDHINRQNTQHVGTSNQVRMYDLARINKKCNALKASASV